MIGGTPIGSGVCPICGQKGQFEIGRPDSPRARDQLLVFHKSGRETKYIKSCYVALYKEIKPFIKREKYTKKGQTCHKITLKHEDVSKARRETWRKIYLRLKKARERRK